MVPQVQSNDGQPLLATVANGNIIQLQSGQFMQATRRNLVFPS